jgi:hypothetical protein
LDAILEEAYHRCGQSEKAPRGGLGWQEQQAGKK